MPIRSRPRRKSIWRCPRWTLRRSATRRREEPGGGRRGQFSGGRQTLFESLRGLPRTCPRIRKASSGVPLIRRCRHFSRRRRTCRRIRIFTSFSTGFAGLECRRGSKTLNEAQTWQLVTFLSNVQKLPPAALKELELPAGARAAQRRRSAPGSIRVPRRAMQIGTEAGCEKNSPPVRRVVLLEFDFPAGLGLRFMGWKTGWFALQLRRDPCRTSPITRCIEWTEDTLDV